MIHQIHSEQELQTVVEAIFTLQKKGIFLLYGNLGAGKTTLIKKLLAHLKVLEPTSSPTYSIVNQHTTSDQKKITHADLYRIQTIDELLDIGWMDLLDQSDFVFIEWPDIALPFLEKTYVKIEITRPASENVRTISISLIS